MSSIIKVDTVQDIDGNNIINENANTITIGASGDTITIPSGATLANNGTATGFASIAWQATIVTGTTLTAVAGNGYWINTSSNACTVTLPAAASVGDQIILVDYDRTWGTNNLTINRNGLNYQGGTENPVYDTDGQTVNIVYSGATNGWIPISDDDVANEGTIPPYSVDFLVIAGGGSGGKASTVSNSEGGGGGGAGGYRTSTQTLTPATVYTITVGDGGALVSSINTQGNNGSNSSISGSGLTTITSTGGGGGGAIASAGSNGGSGGGGGSGASPPYAGGLGNTPSTSPSQGNNGGPGSNSGNAAGGGGAGAVGVLFNGGNGTASSITGSSVTRAGGGGGGVFVNGGEGAGGTGGGGTGGSDQPSTVNGTAGTANTGSGGGGAGGTNSNSGAGGKGVVILSMPDASYSGTTTGSPTVATGVSGQTVLTFTGSGSYTA